MESRPERFEAMARAAGRDVDASRAAVTVMKAGARLSLAIERALSDADLTLPQFNVLMELAASPGGSLPIHAVVERLIGTPANLSWLSTRMRDLGLITKRRDADDGRVVVLAISEAGWSALEQAMPRVFAAEKELWRRHEPTDLRALVGHLDHLLSRPG